jgi:lipoprotein YgeR
MRKTWMLLLLLFPVLPVYGSNFAYHTIQKGETLYRISRKYDISIDELCRLNSIQDVTRVRSGMKIKIPQMVKYLDYPLPVEGAVEDFVTQHFRGIVIFPESVDSVPVKAPDDGRVWFVDRISGYGLTIVIKHSDGYITTYSGFSSTTIKPGDRVSEGDDLGLTGRVRRYKKPGILFSVQYKGTGLRFDSASGRFIKG